MRTFLHTIYDYSWYSPFVLFLRRTLRTIDTQRWIGSAPVWRTAMSYVKWNFDQLCVLCNLDLWKFIVKFNVACAPCSYIYERVLSRNQYSVFIRSVNTRHRIFDSRTYSFEERLKCTCLDARGISTAILNNFILHFNWF
jgi:hypothetical protein